MSKLTAMELPDNHVQFAKDVAAAAEKHGVEKFVLEYQPEFDISNAELTFWGKLKIVFGSKDGRGRPANNLKILFETNLEHVISSTPESSN